MKKKQQAPDQLSKRFKTTDFDKVVADEILRELENRTNEEKFSFIIWLQASRILQVILQNAESLSQKAIRIIEFIKYYENEFFHKLASSDTAQFYNKIYSREDVRKIAEKEKEIVKETFGNPESLSQMHRIAMKMANFKSEKKYPKQEFNREVKKLLDIAVNNEIRPFDEICFNWIRSLAEEIRNDESSLCCKVLYLGSEEIKFNETNTQQFKCYQWPIADNSMIANNFRKSIIGFLNKNGGIIYNGIGQDSNTAKTIIKGIPLTPIELKSFYELIFRIIENIYPKHPEFEKKSHANKSIGFSKIRDSRKINQYITYEYESLVNSEDFTSVKDQMKDGKEKNQHKTLYLVKIIVEPGHPEHLYHLIVEEKDQNNYLEFYVRDEKETIKKKFADAHQIIMKKTKNFLNSGGKIIKPPPFHEACRYEQRQEEYQ